MTSRVSLGLVQEDFVDPRPLVVYSGRQTVVSVPSDLSSPVLVVCDPLHHKIAVVADGSSVLRLPVLSALLGETRTSSGNGDPRPGGQYLCDWSSATLSEVSTVRLFPPKTPNDPTLPRVAVVHSGKIFRAPDDFWTELAGDKLSVRLNFSSSSSIPPRGTRVDVYYDVAERCEEAGALPGGHFSLDPVSGDRVRVYYLVSDDDSTPPKRIEVRAEPFYQLAPLVWNRLPEGLRDDADGLIRLLEDFWDHVCARGAPFDLLTSVDEFRDPDATSEVLFERLKSERAPFLGKSPAADPRLVLKHAVRFYEAKGTKKSRSFYMRTVFGATGESVDLARRVFRTSDAKWSQDRRIQVVSLRQLSTISPTAFAAAAKRLGSPTADPSTFGDETLLPLLAGKRIRGSVGGATAFVERVTTKAAGSVTVTELWLSKTDGDFLAGELAGPMGRLPAGLPAGMRTPTALHFWVGSALTGLSMPDSSSIARVSKLAPVTLTGLGPNASAIVSAVDSGGRPTAFEILDDGWADGSAVSASMRDVDGRQVTLVAQTGTTRVFPGEFVGGSSWASSHGFALQDGRRTDLHAYALRSDLPETDWREGFREWVHVAGRLLWSELDDGLSACAVGPSRTTEISEVAAGDSTAWIMGNFDATQLDVFAGGVAVRNQDLVVSVSGNVTFVKIPSSDESRSVVTTARANAEPDSMLPFWSDAVATAPTSVSATTTSPDATGFVAGAVGRALTQEASPWSGDSMRFAQWGTFSDDAMRSATVGATLTDAAGKVGVVVAGATDGTVVGLVLRFASTADANAFSFVTGVKRVY